MRVVKSCYEDLFAAHRLWLSFAPKWCIFASLWRVFKMYPEHCTDENFLMEMKDCTWLQISRWWHEWLYTPAEFGYTLFEVVSNISEDFFPFKIWSCA